MKRIIEIFGEPITLGGQESYLINVLKNINMEYFHIDFYTPYYCDNKEYRKFANVNNSIIFEGKIPFEPGKSRRNVIKPLEKYLSAKDYDIAHIHSGSITILAYCSMAAKKSGIKKVIVHSHCNGPKESIKHLALKQYGGLYIRRYATHYCACSVAAAEWKFTNDILDKTIILKNGIDTDKFSYNEKTRTRIRKQLKFDDDCYVIGNVGRFSPEKNQSYLIKIFSKLNEHFPNKKTGLLLVGNGELRNECQALVQKLGLIDKVVFTGAVINPEDFLQAMDVFAFPSLYEGLGIAAIEAIDAGLPVVASTNVPKDINLNNQVSFVDLSDEDLWVDRLLKYEGKQRANGSTIILEYGFDIKKTAEDVETLYLQ